MDPLTFVIIALVGVGVGVLSGLFGIGGGVVIVPVLNLCFGLPISVATATSLFTIIPTSISGLVKHYRNHSTNLRFGAILGLAGACTSPLGVYLNEISPDFVVTIVAGLVITLAAVRMLMKGKKRQGGKVADGRVLRIDLRTVLCALLIGAVAGVLSGYVGVGGGFIMVPLMIALMAFPLSYAAGTSLMAVAILAVPGAVAQGMYGNIDYLYGIVLACGSIPGAQLGAWAGTKLPEKALRIAFGCLLIGAGLLMVGKGLIVHG